MSWLDKLERKFGHLAIKGLIRYIIGLNAFVYVLSLIDPTIISKLILYPPFVRQGEVWRLFTYFIIPPQTSPFLIFFALYVAYLIGNSLEYEWGSFRFNLYFLIGIIGTTAAAFITNMAATAAYLDLSLFLAFAHLFPNHEFLLFFILPVKVKYLGWISWAYIIFTVFFYPLPFKIMVILSIINYFIFFGKEIVTRTKTTRQAYYNRQRFHANMPKDFTMHKCTICGITEKDDPKMEFRYCMDCGGEYEYCMEHLKNHEHIQTQKE